MVLELFVGSISPEAVKRPGFQGRGLLTLAACGGHLESDRFPLLPWYPFGLLSFVMIPA